MPYLLATQAPELLHTREVGSAHLLPQPGRVAYLVVQVEGDVAETWRKDTAGGGRRHTQTHTNTHVPARTSSPVCASSPVRDTVTSSEELAVLLSSLLKTSAAACQLSALVRLAAALWWQLARTPSVLLLPAELRTRAATCVSPEEGGTTTGDGGQRGTRPQTG